VTPLSILSTSSEDWQVWTLSVSISSGMLLAILGAFEVYRRRRRRDTSKRRDTG